MFIHLLRSISKVSFRRAVQCDTIRYGRLTCTQKLTGWPA